ncbi:MAG: RNA methyltransferase [Actinomycetes bacterium]
MSIDDADDPRVHEYTRLTDVALRRVREPAEGLFLAEGQTVIERALDAGFVPRSALMEDKWLAGLSDALGKHDVTVYLADQATLKQVIGYRLHRGALAAFTRRPLPPVQAVLARARLVVVLEDLVDHTNVGLIFRSAAGLGADAVLVSPQCADPLYRRSVKVSMGAVFTVPWTRAEPWPWVLDDLATAGYRRVALTPASDAQDLRGWRADPDGRVALLLGSEGPGLSPAALNRVDARVRIPMKGGVDSLNVATAAALAVYTLADGR